MIMKKITFLMMLLMVTYGFSQDVLQDFEDGGLGATFGGSSAAIVADPETGGTRGQVAMLTSNPGGEVWQGINISLLQNVELTTDKTMTLDVYSTTAISIAPKVISSVDGGSDSTAAVSHTGSGWETLTVTFNEGLDNTVTANGVYSAFVIYYNWNTGTNNFGTQDSRVFYVDNISGTAVAAVPDPEPTTAAPTPPGRPAADVISIFSDAYTDIGVDTFDTDWCGATTTEVSIAGNATKKITGLGCEGIDWQSSRTVDASDFTFFHIDIWTGSETADKSFNMKFSDWAGTGGEVNAIEFSATNASTPALPATNPGTWISYDIPISAFTIARGSGAISDIVQFVITSNLGTVYYDNLYLHKDTVLSTNDFDLESVSVSPNPTKDNWNVKTSNGQNITAVEVYDILGKQVLRAVPNASEYAINASELNDGIYLAKIISSTGSTTVKLVKD